jgi:hypothetical protein
MKEQINTIKPEYKTFSVSVPVESLEDYEERVLKNSLVREAQRYKTATYILLVGYLIMLLLKSL